MQVSLNIMLDFQVKDDSALGCNPCRGTEETQFQKRSFHNNNNKVCTPLKEKKKVLSAVDLRGNLLAPLEMSGFFFT